MTFPLVKEDANRSVFVRIAENIRFDPLNKTPHLSRVYVAMRLAFDHLGLNCGTIDEFTNSVVTVCRNDLSVQSTKSQRQKLIDLLTVQSFRGSDLHTCLQSADRPHPHRVRRVLDYFKNSIYLHFDTDLAFAINDFTYFHKVVKIRTVYALAMKLSHKTKCNHLPRSTSFVDLLESHGKRAGGLSPSGVE